MAPAMSANAAKPVARETTQGSISGVMRVLPTS
jgi:hypothetical protein